MISFGMKRIVIAGMGLLAATTMASAASPEVNLNGVWLTQSGESRVRIGPCGDAWCGVIAWTKAGGKDSKNSDPALRDRNLAGMQMFSMKKSAPGLFSGQLYNPQDGKTYTGKLETVDQNAVKLKGCVMGGLVCKSQTWTRVQ